ncbi:MAG: EAL domain-containing protein, partial [Pseudomonadota bacterium]|nr:EAL domain-containing protein [Pseudomonadota bacterium]
EQIDGVKAVFNQLKAGQFPNQHRNDWVSKQGEVITIDWRNSALLDEKGEVDYILGTGVDVTQMIKDQQALELSAVAFNTQEAMVVTDQYGNILKVNQAFEMITEYSLDEVLGENMRIIQSGRHDKAFYQKMWKDVEVYGFWQGEVWNRRKSGEIFPEWLRITKIMGQQGEVANYIGNFSDISQRKKIEEELEFLAFYDPVTELPNRRLFNDRLEQDLLHCKNGSHALAVLFIDLDNFKHVNDTFGHAFGDELLCAFSQKLQDLLSDDITLSRFGGDEFVIIFSELHASMETAMFQCEHMAQIILEALETGLEVLGNHIFVSSSIGIAISSDCKTDSDTLMKQADTAMYQAKNMGKNTFRFYTESIGESMAERFNMEAALRQDLSIDRGIFVVYQPQYNAQKVIVGAEALVRWDSAVYGMVSPVQFIPVAEDSGLIDELGMLVVNKVLDDIQTLGELFQSSSLQHISINLSIKQLTDPNLANRLLAKFQEHAITPNKVRFEFTESAFLDNALDPKTLFSEMSEIGFTFSLDDFGTGFSSLSYLKELPISELKVDKSFVDGIPHEESDTTICSATIGMAQKLGLELVAEGVETQEQFDWLAEQGCDLLQGYLMSRPIPFEEFNKLLKESNQ